MSQMTPDAPPRTARPAGAPRPGGAPPASGGGAAFLTRKAGPFPVWVWVAVVGGLFGWRYVASHKAGAAGTSTADTSAGSTDTGTPADQVPQFVNQTYTTVTPPASPVPASRVPTPVTHPGMTTHPAAQANQYAIPKGLTSSLNGKSATITWLLSGQPSPAPGSYTVAVFDAKGKDITTQTVSVPDTTGGRGTITIPNLPAGVLHANVWANGGRVAPQHATTTFTVK